MGRLELLNTKDAALSLSGTAITTGFNFSAAVITGQALRVSVWFGLTTAASGSLYTSADFKLQASYGDGNWTDIQCVQASTGTAAASFNVLPPAAGVTSWNLFQTNAFNPAPGGLRIGVRFNGNAGVAGDIVLCNVAVM